MIKNHTKSHQQHKSKEKNVVSSAAREEQKVVDGSAYLRSVVTWFLVQRTGTIAFRLNPSSVILIGREECDINIQSTSVEKRHAVLCFDPNSESFSVKDLNSTNGTFLNNRRISSADRPEKLSNMDLLRFGYDSNLYEIRLGSASGPGVLPNEQKTSLLNYSPTTSEPGFSSGLPSSERFSHVMQQPRGNSLYGSRVSSPSLTLDSGRGSSSAPSSPSKEMSPGPVSSNMQISPSLSRRMTKQTHPEISNTSTSFATNNSKGPARLNFSSQQNPEHHNHRRVSLEEEIDNVIDTLVFPKCKTPTLRSSSAIMNELGEDLNVPNEVFSQDSRMMSSYNKPDEIKNMSLRDNMEQISLTSESNKSVESDTQSDATGNNKEKKKVSPMAFTVDFDDGPKKFGISDSISKFAPRHRRNLSLTKPEDVSAKIKDNNKDDSLRKDPTSLTIGLGRLASNNNKTVIESDNNKNSSSSNLATKNFKTANKLISCDNSRSDSNVETESNTSSKKSRNEFSSKLRKPTLSSSLFSSRLQSSSENEASTFNTTNSSKITIKKSQAVESKSSEKSSSKKVVGVSKGKLQLPEVVDKDKEDASSETGTYTIEKDNPDVEKARKDIESLLCIEEKNCDSRNSTDVAMHLEQTVGSGAPEWVREWAEQAAIQHKKIKDLNPLTDTQLFLRETENVVSAMQERVTRNLSNNNSSHNSDSDDEATLSHTSPQKVVNRFKRPISTRTSPLPREASVLSDSGYQIGYQSDSSNEGLREYKNIGAVKMNKAFNIRRGRVVGYDYASDGCQNTALNRHSLTLPVRGISPRPSTSTPSSQTNSAFGRNDGGRYSLRMPKSRTPPNQMPPPMAPPPRSSPAPRLSSKTNTTIDHNANRRPPPITNLNSRKPPTGNRSNSTLTAKEVELANWRRRKSYDPMRAAAEGRKKKGTDSATENSVDELSPTSISKNSQAMMSKSMSFHMENNYNQKCQSAEDHDEEDMIYVVDEMDSSHSNSPIHLPMNSRSSHEDGHYYGMSSSHSPLRPKNKLEALDNLVIATIHSLSNKVRTSSRQLLQKLQLQHVDNENGALLEEMVSQLKELEMSNSNSSPTKSPSRELSGTLKNLKKLEQVILVLDRVLCDDSGSDANT